ATLLAPLAVLAHLPEAAEDPGLGERYALLVLVLAAVVNQLAGTVQALRGRPGLMPRTLVLLYAALGLAAMAWLVGAELAPAASGGGVRLGYIGFWIWLAAGLAVSYLLTARPAPVRSIDLPGRAMEFLAPAVLLAAALVGTVFLGLRGYEILLAVAAVFSVAMALLPLSAARKGWYLLATQAAILILSMLLGWDLTGSVHVLFAVAAGTATVQEATRLLLAKKLDGFGLQSAGAWASLALLAVLPLLYAAIAPAERGVICLQLLLLLAVAVGRFGVHHRHAGFVIVLAAGALIAALSDALFFAGGGWMPTAVLSAEVAALVALVLAGGAVWLRLRDSGRTHRVLLLGGATAWVLESLLLSLADGAWMTPVALFAAAVMFFVLSHREAQPWLYPAGAGTVLAGSAVLMDRLDMTGLLDLPVPAGRWLAAGWLAAVVLYGFRLVQREREGVHPVRAISLPAIGLGALGMAALIALVPDRTAVAAALSMVAVAALLVVEVPLRRKWAAAEAAVVPVVAALQRLFVVAEGALEPYWALQWWVVAGALTAAFEFGWRRAVRGTVALSISAGLLSLSVLAAFISGDLLHQVWALVGHAGLVAFGLMTSRRLFLIWGACGIALTLLWFMRGYTFLLLFMAALGLLAFAIWKLAKHSGSGRPPANRPYPPPPVPPTGQGYYEEQPSRPGYPMAPTAGPGHQVAPPAPPAAGQGQYPPPWYQPPSGSAQPTLGPEAPPQHAPQ
ncbi:hypothetical protein D477_004781, partial [Arthrobacter crystallopoietes BAB-32]